jgi:hypothetical protein
MSLYDETIARFAQRALRSLSFSVLSIAAKPCARFVHDNVLRLACERLECSVRSRYSVRDPALRARMRSVTERTRSCKGAAMFTRVLDSMDRGGF